MKTPSTCWKRLALAALLLTLLWLPAAVALADEPTPTPQGTILCRADPMAGVDDWKGSVRDRKSHFGERREAVDEWMLGGGDRWPNGPPVQDTHMTQGGQP